MKFFSNGLRIALGSMLMLLAACDDARQSSVTFRLDDVWSFARGAMNSRPLPVDIRGLPYGGDGAALHDAVIGAMTKAITWSANPRFTADSASAGRSTLRVVVTLNGGGGFSGRDPCPGKAEGGGQLPDGRVREIATFCDGEDVLANVHGHVGRSAGVDDPRFSRLIRQVTRDMFAVTNGT